METSGSKPPISLARRAKAALILIKLNAMALACWLLADQAGFKDGLNQQTAGKWQTGRRHTRFRGGAAEGGSGLHRLSLWVVPVLPIIHDYRPLSASE